MPDAVDAADPALLDAYLDEVAERTGTRPIPADVFAFGNSAEMADELARLVRDEDKRATAGWLAPGESTAPAPGDLSVVLDGQGRPAATVRTDEVVVQALTAVDPAFAWDEGEGDRTRTWWLEGHDRFFRREAEHSDRPYDPEERTFRFERFSLVDPDPGAPEPLVRQGDAHVRPLRADERAWVRALLGDQADAPEVLEASGGWPADRCPALLARDGFRSTGLLVFVPHPDRVDEVRLVALDGKRDDPDAVEAILRAGLEVLRQRYGWGTSG